MSVILKFSPGFGDSFRPQAEVDLAAGEQDTGASIGSLLARAGISPKAFGEAVNSELRRRMGLVAGRRQRDVLNFVAYLAKRAVGSL